MIYQNDKKENPRNQFTNTLKELKIGKLMRKSNTQNRVVFLHMRYFNFYYC